MKTCKGVIGFGTQIITLSILSLCYASYTRCFQTSQLFFKCKIIICSFVRGHDKQNKHYLLQVCSKRKLTLLTCTAYNFILHIISACFDLIIVKSPRCSKCSHKYICSLEKILDDLNCLTID